MGHHDPDTVAIEGSATMPSLEQTVDSVEMGAEASAAADATSTQAPGPHEAHAEKSKSDTSEAGAEQASNGAEASAVAAAVAVAATTVSYELANKATPSTQNPDQHAPARELKRPFTSAFRTATTAE